MTDDDLDLARRLFATATAMLEDATELAIAGQSSKRKARELVELAQRVQAAASDIATIAEGVAIMASRSRETGGGRLQKRSS